MATCSKLAWVAHRPGAHRGGKERTKNDLQHSGSRNRRVGGIPFIRMGKYSVERAKPGVQLGHYRDWGSLGPARFPPDPLLVPDLVLAGQKRLRVLERDAAGSSPSAQGWDMTQAPPTRGPHSLGHPGWLCARHAVPTSRPESSLGLWGTKYFSFYGMTSRCVGVTSDNLVAFLAVTGNQPA